MRLHHVALWCSNVDDAASFWERYFDAVVGDQYESRRQAGFFSRFAHIEAADLRIELMTKPGLSGSGECFGWAHIAISLGTRLLSMKRRSALRRTGGWCSDRERPVTATMRPSCRVQMDCLSSW